MRCQSSSVVLVTRAETPPPALATSTSTGDQVCSISSKIASTDVTSVMSAGSTSVGPTQRSAVSFSWSGLRAVIATA